MHRRTLLTSLIVAAAVLPIAAATIPAQSSHAAARGGVAPAAAMPAAAVPAGTLATRATTATPAAESPTVQVYAAGNGIVAENAALSLSVFVSNSTASSVAGGTVKIAVTKHAITTTAALDRFEQSPTTTASRSLASTVTAGVGSGASATVATVDVPADSVDLPASAPGVFGLTARLTTADGVTTTGTGTLVVPGKHPSTVGVAAVMAMTAPAGTTGVITSQDLASDTSSGGVLAKQLQVAQRNPAVTIGIDPMVLASIRVLGPAAPASAQTWLLALSKLPNATFPLQYADADPGLQIQAGLRKPLAPLDFSYAMSASTQATPPTIGEPTEASPTPTPATPTPSPTSDSQSLTLAQLTAWPYSLNGIAWPAAGSVRAADLAAFARAGMPSTIVSASNTNASTLATTPDSALSTTGGTALVTDDAVSEAMVAVATSSGAAASGVANAALMAQLALAARNSQSGAVILVSLGRSVPTNSARAAAAVGTALNSRFSMTATMRDALNAPPTAGLKLVDKTNAASRVTTVQELLDLAGEPRTGGSVPDPNIASFSTALSSPELLTGETRAQLLSLFSVSWSNSSAWASAAAKQLASMNATLSAVQIVAPESVRQASRQALIPITVVNKLTFPIDVVLRATPSSARLAVADDTSKKIPAGSSVKVLVPVKAQLSNGQVWLALQLYSTTGVEVGDASGASVTVHADWEGIGALIFVVIVVGFFGFGLVRTVQRRRRERAAAGRPGDGDGDGSDGDGSGGDGAQASVVAADGRAEHHGGASRGD